MGFHYQVIFWLAVFTPALLAYPHQSLLDPIDMCIIACDSCYKGAAVVKCANECINTGGQMGLKWSAGCPRFNLAPYDVNFEE